MTIINNIISLIRPHQWLKNTFVLLPLFFSGRIFDNATWLPCIVALVSFCFASSGIYCLNDIHDVESDRRHIKKKLRPIASGKISIKCAYIIMFLCWLVSICLIATMFFHDKLIKPTLLIVLGYIIMNVAYSLKLKQYAIIDVFIIAFGFILRLVLGGYVAHVNLSHWIVLMTFLLSLFIAFAKRRDDVIEFEKRGEKMRYNINRYNLTFVNMSLCMLSSITVVCYIMYTVSEEVILRIGNHYLFITSFFVLAGILRYMQITIVDEKSGSPTKVLMNDIFLRADIICWIIVFGLILYL